MTGQEKIVDYSPWCKKCRHRRKREDEEPCRECLESPTNTDSRQPTKFEGVAKR